MLVSAPVLSDDVFWSKVDKAAPTECWMWRGSRNAKGYGRCRRDGRFISAPRVAWALGNGRSFPADLLACHSCDNPGCVNPAHIWPGTAAENTQDAIAKGRFRFRPKLPPKKRVRAYRPTKSRFPWKLYGPGRLCRKCGHHRTDDYVYTGDVRVCRPCSLAKSKRKRCRATAAVNASHGVAA